MAGGAVCAAALLLAGSARPAASASPAAPQPEPPPRKIDLLEFRVEGNTLLPQPEIEAVLYPYLGPGRSAEDAEHARAALEELFGKHGYPTVSATLPPQDGAGGIVRIVVIERPIGRLRVVGSQYVAPGAIKAGVPSLAPGHVPHMPDVQADLVAVNQLPDRSITPALTAGRDPDTVDVDLKVDDHLPFHGSLELNNRRSQQTTALRDSGSLSYNNLWQRGDSITAGFQVAPLRLNDAKVGNLSYTYRIPDSRASLTASYVQSDSSVSTGPSGNVVGRGKIAGLRVLMPFSGDETFTHSLTAGFDYKDLTEDVGAGQAVTHSPIAYVPFTASYLASWNGTGSSTDASGTLIWATRSLGNGWQNFDNKRAYAQPDFAYLKADFDHTHTLPYNLEVYAHGTVQVSPSPLVSSEQFSIGGMDTVRGYLESESLGDYGGAGELELHSPPLARYIGNPVNNLRFLTFVDAGATKIHLPQSGQHWSDTLASAGVGASMRLFGHLGAEVDDAEVLLAGPATRAGANRVLFRLYGDF